MYKEVLKVRIMELEHKIAEMHSQTMVDEAQLNALRKELIGLRMSEFEEELRESPQELLKG